MTPNDFQRFRTLWRQACEVQAGQIPSNDAVRLISAMLKNYTLDEIEGSLLDYMRGSRFAPTPSDIITGIIGEMPPLSSLVELASAREGMFGVVVEQDIGRHDLNTLAHRDLVHRIKPHIGKYFEFWQRALVGDFTDTELRAFLARGINIAHAPLGGGAMGVRKPYRAKVVARVRGLESQARIAAPTMQQLEEVATEEQAAGHLAKLTKLLGRTHRRATPRRGR